MWDETKRGIRQSGIRPSGNSPLLFIMFMFLNLYLAIANTGISISRLTTRLTGTRLNGVALVFTPDLLDRTSQRFAEYQDIYCIVVSNTFFWNVIRWINLMEADIFSMHVLMAVHRIFSGGGQDAIKFSKNLESEGAKQPSCSREHFCI